MGESVGRSCSRTRISLVHLRTPSKDSPQRLSPSATSSPHALEKTPFNWLLPAFKWTCLHVDLHPLGTGVKEQHPPPVDQPPQRPFFPFFGYASIHPARHDAVDGVFFEVVAFSPLLLLALVAEGFEVHLLFIGLALDFRKVVRAPGPSGSRGSFVDCAYPVSTSVLTYSSSLQKAPSPPGLRVAMAIVPRSLLAAGHLDGALQVHCIECVFSKVLNVQLLRREPTVHADLRSRASHGGRQLCVEHRTAQLQRKGHLTRVPSTTRHIPVGYSQHGVHVKRIPSTGSTCRVHFASAHYSHAGGAGSKMVHRSQPAVA